MKIILTAILILLSTAINSYAVSANKTHSAAPPLAPPPNIHKSIQPACTTANPCQKNLLPETNTVFLGKYLGETTLKVSDLESDIAQNYMNLSAVVSTFQVCTILRSRHKLKEKVALTFADNFNYFDYDLDLKGSKKKIEYGDFVLVSSSAVIAKPKTYNNKYSIINLINEKSIIRLPESLKLQNLGGCTKEAKAESVIEQCERLSKARSKNYIYGKGKLRTFGAVPPPSCGHFTGLIPVYCKYQRNLTFLEIDLNEGSTKKISFISREKGRNSLFTHNNYRELKNGNSYEFCYTEPEKNIDNSISQGMLETLNYVEDQESKVYPPDTTTYMKPPPHKKLSKLGYAIYDNDALAVKEILESGADPYLYSQTHKENKFSALHKASSACAVSIVEILMPYLKRDDLLIEIERLNRSIIFYKNKINKINAVNGSKKYKERLLASNKCYNKIIKIIEANLIK